MQRVYAQCNKQKKDTYIFVISVYISVQRVHMDDLARLQQLMEKFSFRDSHHNLMRRCVPHAKRK